MLGANDVATSRSFTHLMFMQDAANETPTVEVDVQPFRGARWKRRVFGGVMILLAGLILFAWLQRTSIADRFVQDELASRGIKASYTIDTVGLRTQRIRNLVIGDPTRPDLTANWVEVDVAINFSGASVRDVRADGVMMRGRYVDGKLAFGELDKFADPASTEPFELPDIGLVINNARARIDTPWGVVGAGLNGRGLLRNRFAANLSLRSPEFAGAGCRAPTLKFDGKLLLEWRQPHLIGPITAAALDCKPMDLAITSPLLSADIKLSERFDRWVGHMEFAAPAASYADAKTQNLAGRLEVDGGASRTNFAIDLDRGSLRVAPLTARRLILALKGYAGVTQGKFAISARGDAGLNGASLDRGATGDLGGIAAATRDSPVGPIMAQIAPILVRAGDNFSANLAFDVYKDFQGRAGGSIESLAVKSASGVRLRQDGTAAISQAGKSWRLNAPIRLSISGRNLPNASVSLAQAGENWSGKIAIAPFAARGARLAVSNLAFNGRPGAIWRFDGRATLSGPLAGGFVTGLNVPVVGRYGSGSFALYETCQNVGFDGLRLSSLNLRAQTLRLCPDRGRAILTTGGDGTRISANLANLNVGGDLGGSPLSARSANVRFTLHDGFAANDVRVDLGPDDARTYFEIANISGDFEGQGVTGTLSGGAGQIGNVPLLMADASGNWRYLSNILTLNGSLKVLDAEQVDRFKPMAVPDLMLTLEKNVISAIGSLMEPTTGTKVADVDIRHNLDDSVGRALLAVDELRFDKRFQPELITPLTLGVVANVDGTISGDGRIDWGGGVRSTGRVVTRGMNLAAAFGPVEGLSTELVFSDLLGLESGPGQLAMLASVNPGIPAYDGRISYQLLPDRQVAIESGRWPFAGGELVLEPTVLDFGVEKERRLTFRVIGVDAEKLLAGYDFQNLRVTGVFDGTLPMIFNQDGGRIVGGSLVSRAGGGEVSYLGELAYEDMGVFANYAFNALRSIRYSTLTIGVGGELDGEIVTEISFTGLQQGSLAKRNFITRQLARIPIKFNVSITAEFMKLIGSIRGLYDADYAAERDLPYLIEQQKKDAAAVATKPAATENE